MNRWRVVTERDNDAESDGGARSVSLFTCSPTSQLLDYCGPDISQVNEGGPASYFEGMIICRDRDEKTDVTEPDPPEQQVHEPFLPFDIPIELCSAPKQESPQASMFGIPMTSPSFKLPTTSHQPTPVQSPISSLQEVLTSSAGFVKRCSTQTGSRMLQTMLASIEKDTAPTEFHLLNQFVTSILEPADFLRASFDPFGNYVVQRIIEVLSAGGGMKKGVCTKPTSPCDIFVHLVQGNSVALSFGQFGCRVAQALIERSTTARQLVIREIKEADEASSSTRIHAQPPFDPSLIDIAPDVTGPFLLVKAICDANANHVLQRLVELSTPTEFDFVVDGLVAAPYYVDYINSMSPSNKVTGVSLLGPADIPESITNTIRKREIGYYVKKLGDREVHPLNNAVYCALSRFGCLVLQKLVLRCSVRQCTLLCSALAPSALTLAASLYGNYVAQTALRRISGVTDQGRVMKGADAFVNALRGHEAQLALLKHASNVIEVALDASSAETRELMIDELTSGESLIQLVVGDYGNYVVQKAIGLASIEQTKRMHNTLFSMVQPSFRSNSCLKSVEKQTIVRNILSLCRRRVETLSNSMGSGMRK